MRLVLRERVFELEPGRPLLMGIVNVGPDSFSDSVRLQTLGAALDHARGLLADGADLIDVGAESGVTYSPANTPDDEVRRVVPLVAALAAEGVAVSVDTYKAQVAAAVLEAGAAMINDTSGLRDPRLAALCVDHGAALVVMHTRAAPKREAFPDYGGRVVDDVVDFLRERLDVAQEQGLDAEHVVLDPGPDFAKRPDESVAVLQALGRLTALERPVLAAISRKYFLGAITGRPPQERIGATLAAAAFAVQAGASILRVHDVAAVADHLRVARVLAGDDPMPPFDPADERLKWIRPAGGVRSVT
jgi:dihydropteroate synthase